EWRLRESHRCLPGGCTCHRSHGRQGHHPQEQGRSSQEPPECCGTGAQGCLNPALNAFSEKTGSGRFFCFLSFCFLSFCFLSFCFLSFCFLSFCFLSFCFLSLCANIGVREHCARSFCLSLPCRLPHSP